MDGKESCNKMALKCCTSSTEMRLCRKLTYPDSPVSSEILLPVSFNRLLAEELRTPRISTQLLLSVWQAKAVLSLLLEAVDVAVDESLELSSDFSLVSTPRKPQTAELSVTPDDGGMNADNHYSCPAAVFSVCC